MASDVTSRVEEIATTLREDILRGRHRPGERLPSERDLAAKLGAHRSSVREALKKLEQLGLLDIRPGGGARVAPLDRASLEIVGHILDLDGPPDRAIVEQLLDVHELLTVGAVRFAIERASESEIEQARRELRRLADPSTSDQAYLRSIETLMELISTASHNLVLRLARKSLRTSFARRLPAGHLRLRPPRSVISPLTRRIDEALAERNASAAEVGVRELLRANRERLLKALDAELTRLRPSPKHLEE